MIYFIYTFFLFSIFARFFWNVSLVIGGGGVWSSDILTIIILLVFIIKIRSIKNLEYLFVKTKSRKLISLMLILFIIPIIIGVIKGFYIVTVLRDARFILIYTMPFVFLLTIKSKKELLKILLFMYKVILLNLIIFFVMMVFNIKLSATLGIDVDYSTLAGTIHRYGISTATFFYSILFFVLFNLWTNNVVKRKIFLIIMIGLLFAILYYSMRTLTSGVLFALLLNIIMLKNKEKVINYSLAVGLFFILIINFIPTSTFYKIPQVERYMTIFDSRVGNAVEEKNKKVRIDAIIFAFEFNDNPLIGTGYGDKETYSKFKRDNLARWWNHSAVGWMIYKLGIIISGLFLYLFFSFLYNAFNLYNKIKDKFIKNTLIGICFHLISLLGLAFGTNVFFRGDFLTMLVAIDIGIILVIENIYNKDPKIII